VAERLAASREGLSSVKLMTLPFAFFFAYVQLRLIFSSFPLYFHYMVRPNRASSGVPVVVMKESASHCDAVLLSLCSCFGLFLLFVG
jgi:hypothetical protein